MTVHKTIVKQEFMGRNNRLLSFRYILRISYKNGRVYLLPREVFTEPLPSNGGVILIQAHRQQGNAMSLLLFFQNKGSGLENPAVSNQIIYCIYY
jgi:hypothetical protein